MLLTRSLRSGVLTLLFASFASPAAHAFSRQGHQIICAIAMRELAPTAAARVNGLMNGDSGYNTFWEACAWADDPPARRRPEHFVNVPRTTTEIAGATCPIASECLFTAITEDAAIVPDRTMQKAKRRAALKYLGHWVGDLHQPLHVSFEDDRGGNEIRTTGLCTGKLHSAWDKCLVALQTGTGNPNTVARRLHATISDADRASWSTGDPGAWAKEAYVITIDAQSAYCERKNGACYYDDEREEFDGTDKKTVRIDSAYVAANGPLVELQMKRAGVRLGKMLNDLLDE